MLQQQVDVAHSSNARPVVVVLGAHDDVIISEVDKEKAHVAINSLYKEGMASSISRGLHTLLEISGNIDAAIVMVCDQPFVTPALLNELAQKYRATCKPIITCSYANTFGPPTLFDKTMFDKLLQLEGDVGARRVVQQHFDKVDMVTFPQGEIDIDTEEDYDNLVKKQF